MLRNMLRRILKVITLLAMVISLPVIHWVVPQTDVVRVVGVEVKRVDQEGNVATGTGSFTHDVYFVQAEDIDTAKPRVYRNEDNLLYLKWDSSDRQARARSLAADKEIVALRHYGWRIRLFSVFPNLLNIKPVEADHGTIPWLFFIMLALVWGGLLLFYRRFVGFGGSRENTPSDISEHDNRDDMLR